MDEILTRITAAEAQIAKITNKVAYRDLRKMLGTIDKVVTEISKEQVECNRRKGETRMYAELKQKAHTLLDTLEQHITLAALLG